MNLYESYQNSNATQVDLNFSGLQFILAEEEEAVEPLPHFNCY